MAQLTLKYRPNKWNSVKGNEDTVRSLQALTKEPLDQIPHSLLFYGHHGTGKTTCARIFAKAIGCDGQDLTEMNSSQFNGIATIRDIIKDAPYGSLNGGPRVWIMDECHKLSSDAQGAFLKLLEEPPPHAFFILCTTEETKLIPTVRSRLSDYHFAPIETDEICKRLDFICRRNKFDIPEDVIQKIAEDSLGSMRDGISVLEVICRLPKNRMKDAADKKARELNAVIDLCRAIGKKAGWKTVSGIMKNLPTSDSESIRRAIMGYCCSWLKNSGQAAPYIIMDCFRGNTYTNGMNDLWMMAYEACNEIEG